MTGNMLRQTLQRTVKQTARRGQHLRVAVASINTNPSTSVRCISNSSKREQVKKANDNNETMLMQQLLDAMDFEEDDEQKQTDAVKLPLTGVVLDIKNNIASISGLRHATIGSVVSISTDTEPICRGIVLFLQKSTAHVALLSDSDTPSVHIGMSVNLEAQELKIPVSLGYLSGNTVDPLGTVLPLEHMKASEIAANDHISVAWGSKTVPKFMSRASLKTPMQTGITALDCLQPLAFGHRVGVVGPRNTGKTKLVLDIISQQIRAAKEKGEEPSHYVYVSVGKSAARVQQIQSFLHHTDALPYTTLVSANDHSSPIMQYLAPFTGCAIAEYFKAYGKTSNSVVIYDDLATHTMVVESLVTSMKLPKISQLQLSAHAVLMERSAQFQQSSLTSFVIAETSDVEVTEFQERISSMVDATIVLKSQLALQKVYPAMDVLQPGASIRGPPFQSTALWLYMTRVRSRINHAAQVQFTMEVSSSLGIESEPETLEEVEYQTLVRQFFSQTPLHSTTQVEREIGVFALSILEMSKLPSKVTWTQIQESLMQKLAKEEIQRMESYPTTQQWTEDMEQILTTRVEEVVDELVKLQIPDPFSRSQYPSRTQLLQRFRR